MEEKESNSEEKEGVMSWKKICRIIIEMGENIKEECIRSITISYIQIKHKIRLGKKKVKYVCCRVREDKTDTSCKCEEKKK